MLTYIAVKYCGYIGVSFQVVDSCQFKLLVVSIMHTFHWFPCNCGIWSNDLFQVSMLSDTECTKLCLERLLLKFQFLFLSHILSAI